MELKPGYKLTEVGVIPEDWADGKIGDLNPFITSGSRGWAEFYSDRGMPFIRITNMSRESIYLDLSDLRLVNLPPDQNESKRTQLQNNDVLISITADIGIIGYVDDSVQQPAYINQHIALVRFDSARVSSRFISYFLASEKSQRFFRSLTDVGAKAGMSLGTVNKIRLALPSITEQNAIATALSDVDTLIRALDQLIAKKRDLKQATMQQLLTGKQRLPGFSGKWEVRRLGEIGSFSKGKGLSKSDLSSSGVLPAIPYTAIYTDFNEIIDHSKISQFVNSLDDTIIINEPHLLIASSSNMLENIGKITAFLDRFEVAVGGDIILYKTIANVCFISYLLSTRPHRKRIVFLSQGSTIRHVYASTFANYEIAFPSLPEQTAIATILSDMDAEIAALEQRCDKTRALKQGMMQELLTGRIRLVSTETVNENQSLPTKPRRQPHPAIAGKGKTLGDLVSPIVDESEWDCLK